MTVLWPVQPGAEPRVLRPSRLIAALMVSGALEVDDLLSHSGRPGRSSTVVTIGSHTLQHRSVWLPLLLRRSPTISAQLTPLVPPQRHWTLRWLDCYDDWTTSPDVPRAFRLLAGRTYSDAAESRNVVVTVNSQYMRYRLGRSAHLVPNGVDPELAELVTEGDDRRRIVVLGALRDRRTDWQLLSTCAGVDGVEHIVLAGPGTAEGARRLDGHTAAEVSQFENLDSAALAKFVGARTVALLPHVVTDYTLSQDPMKLYQFLALGMPVLVPRMLWPGWLPRRRAFLVERGVEGADLVRAAMHAGLSSQTERREFVGEHGWDARAAAVAELLGG